MGQRRKISLRRIAGMITLVACVAMVGCSNKGENQPTSTNSPPASTSPSEKPSKEPITLKFSSDGPVFVGQFPSGVQTDEIAMEIAKQTGVSLDIDRVNDDKKFNLEMASGELPDIILVTNKDHLNQLIKGNQIIPLDDLLTTNGPDILKELPNRIKISKKFWSADTNKLYALPGLASQFAPQERYESPGYLIRWDYYKELGFPEVNNMDDLLNMLKAMQDKHPTNDQGQKTYGISPYFADFFTYRTFDNAFNRLTANNFISLNPETGEPSGGFFDTDNAFWKGTDFYFKANQLGILDPDSFVHKFENLQEKTKNGLVLFSTHHWLGTNAANELLAAKDPLSGYVGLPYPKGQSMTTDAVSPDGNETRLWVISKNSKHPERAMDLINYILTSEGSRLINDGFEGEQWELDNGKPKVIDADKRNDAVYAEKTGMGKYWNLSGAVAGYNDPKYNVPIAYGQSKEELIKSLSPLNKDYSSHYGVSYPGELVDKRVKSGEINFIFINSAMSYGLDMNTPDDIKRLDAKIADYLARMQTKLILAKSQDEYKSIQKTVLDELKAMEGQKSVDYWMNNYKNAAKIWTEVKS
ncbi:ABC transporter substrate-binding protein [Paenibacillus baekrokdamisoli]|uniref:ABC transporter substrate-binding protein n=1 Tax=Paenibacillus baekrokdamisoli TaxID=1712516 RepID=A0A3G9IQ65_9BACL|nr:extracellular solute-binding protein [Paenibacillus baekrokdamisoli]MBB3072458.1 ABC-type glycerol-3-phosphate transport system substrate-binding protein [Paenibacillus baekrokdamisoli]BBH20516.1 ABC transporter substrate-binding protein [Paenibacillus baekrokdamisoli]